MKIATRWPSHGRPSRPAPALSASAIQCNRQTAQRARRARKPWTAAPAPGLWKLSSSCRAIGDNRSASQGTNAMASTDPFIKLTAQNKLRAGHWRDVHFASARYYQAVEWVLGTCSIVLATLLLGSAGYTVDRGGAPEWLQYGLLGLAIAQASIAAVQSYARPAALAERYRISAANFGSMVRRWELFEMRDSLGSPATVQQVEETMATVDQAVREALQAPWIVLKWKGMPKVPTGALAKSPLEA